MVNSVCQRFNRRESTVVDKVNGEKKPCRRETDNWSHRTHSLFSPLCWKERCQSGLCKSIFSPLWRSIYPSYVFSLRLFLDARGQSPIGKQVTILNILSLSHLTEEEKLLIACVSMDENGHWFEEGGVTLINLFDWYIVIDKRAILSLSDFCGDRIKTNISINNESLCTHTI